MKNLKKGDLKKDVYEEEIIRIDYLVGGNYKVTEKELISEFSKLRVYVARC